MLKKILKKLFGVLMILIGTILLLGSKDPFEMKLYAMMIIGGVVYLIDAEDVKTTE